MGSSLMAPTASSLRRQQERKDSNTAQSSRRSSRSASISENLTTTLSKTSVSSYHAWSLRNTDTSSFAGITSTLLKIYNHHESLKLELQKSTDYISELVYRKKDGNPSPSTAESDSTNLHQGYSHEEDLRTMEEENSNSSFTFTTNSSTGPGQFDVDSPQHQNVLKMEKGSKEKRSDLNSRPCLGKEESNSLSSMIMDIDRINRYNKLEIGRFLSDDEDDESEEEEIEDGLTMDGILSQSENTSSDDKIDNEIFKQDTNQFRTRASKTHSIVEEEKHLDRKTAIICQDYLSSSRIKLTSHPNPTHQTSNSRKEVFKMPIEDVVKFYYNLSAEARVHFIEEANAYQLEQAWGHFESIQEEKKMVETLLSFPVVKDLLEEEGIYLDISLSKDEDDTERQFQEEGDIEVDSEGDFHQTSLMDGKYIRIKTEDCDKVLKICKGDSCVGPCHGALKFLCSSMCGVVRQKMLMF